MNPLQLHIHRQEDKHYRAVSVNELQSVSWQNLPLIVEIDFKDFAGMEELLLSELTEQEKLRSFNYQKRQDALRFIVGRAFLRRIISQFTGVHAGSIVIGQGPNLKPELRYPELPLNFNVSHAGTKVILAFDKHPIGIDIESSENALKTPLFGHKVLSVSEQKNLLTEGNYRENFCLYWTRKEAFLKAIGKGIDDDVVNIPALDGRYKVWGLESDGHRDWSVLSFNAGDGYICSLACSGEMDRTADLQYFKLAPGIH